MDFKSSLKALTGFVLIKMDTQNKAKYSLGNGNTLLIQRGYEFNRRLDYPSMAIIIDGEGLPKGEQVLVHHNASEPHYHVLEDTDMLTEEERREGYKIFSVPKDMCFCYSYKGVWMPCEHFLITLRIFKPYEGRLAGITPQQVKNRMYVINGYSEGNKDERIDLSGKVVCSFDNCDYEIIWMNTNNKEERLIRTRDREVSGIDNDMLKDLKKGIYTIGLSPPTAKKLKDL